MEDKSKVLENKWHFKGNPPYGVPVLCCNLLGDLYVDDLDVYSDGNPTWVRTGNVVAWHSLPSLPEGLLDALNEIYKKHAIDNQNMEQEQELLEKRHKKEVQDFFKGYSKQYKI